MRYVKGSSGSSALQVTAVTEWLSAQVARVTTLIFTIVEALLLGRFLLHLFGANATQPFVAGFYKTTDPLVQPFQGIFPQPAAAPTLELASLLAAIFIVLVTALLMGIVRMLLGRAS